MLTGLVVCGLLWASAGPSSGVSPRRLSDFKRSNFLELEAGLSASPGQFVCMARHALLPMFKCALDAECRKALQCTMAAQKLPASQMCPAVYVCQMQAATNEKFLDFVRHTMPCLTDCPTDGTCLATDEDAVQNITSLDMIQGDWWVIRGVNCGQGTNYPWATKNPTPGMDFPGAYDWLPCQHERILPSTGHDYPHPTSAWVNNITYCGGRNGGLAECTGPVIDTVANITLTAPGVVYHNYTDAPTSPQSEYWRVVSWPHPDYMLMLWCGKVRETFLVYNGGIALSRKRNEDGMPEYVKEAFRAAAKKHNVLWDEMCPSTNEGCP
jgi:hypothetical protein